MLALSPDLLYRALRQALFLLPPEESHRVALTSLAGVHRLGLSRLLFPPPPPSTPVMAMGLRFPNPVGLAAGLDKDARYVDALAALGFGWIEVGTVTLRPQAGHARPRLHRLPEAEALINHMGCNSQGVERVCKRLAAGSPRIAPLGVNIGLNQDTVAERFISDQLELYRRVHPVASYVTVNLSSPNTAVLSGLRSGEESMTPLLEQLCGERDRLAADSGKRVPLVVKLSPDLDAGRLRDCAQRLKACGVDGVIACNTTGSRPEQLRRLPGAVAAGGLSGRPLAALALRATELLAAELGDELVLIASGGICDAAAAADRLRAGARLVQLYTGLIYRGPALVAEVIAAARAVLARAAQD